MTIALTAWLSVAVAAFASRFAANRIQERNLFVVAPLLLICLVAWVERGAPRPRLVALAAAFVAALAPVLIPFERFIETGVVSDTLALHPALAALRAPDRELGRLDCRGRGGRARSALPARAATVGACAAGGRPRHLRVRLPACLVGECAGRRCAGVQGCVGGSALPGDPGRRPRLDRPRGRRRPRCRALVRGARPLRREPERVLQPLGRPRLLRRCADPRRARRDGGDEARVGRHVPHRRGRASARPLRARARLDRAGRRAGRARPRARDDRCGGSTGRWWRRRPRSRACTPATPGRGRR